MSGIFCFILGYATGIAHACYTFNEPIIKVFEATPSQVTGAGGKVVEFSKRQVNKVKETVKDTFTKVEEAEADEELASKEHPRDDEPEQPERVEGEVINNADTNN